MYRVLVYTRNGRERERVHAEVQDLVRTTTTLFYTKLKIIWALLLEDQKTNDYAKI